MERVRIWCTREGLDYMQNGVKENIYRAEMQPMLVKSAESCRIILVPGEKYTQKLTVSAQDGRKVIGIVTSDHRRILLSENELSGNVCEMMLGIDTKGLREGDHIDGAVIFITNLGEDTIPVHVEIVREKKRQQEKEPRNLEEFAEICERSLREGFRIYTGSHFSDLLSGTDAKYRTLYAGMSKNPVTYQHMEEFLVAAGRKEPLLFSIDREEAVFLHLQHSERSTLYLYKNTWGYGQLDVTVQGDFIHVLKRQITTDEFVGKVFSLDFIVDYEKLGLGIRHGSITIHGLHQTFVFRITATVLPEEDLIPDHRAGKKMVSLVRSRLAEQQGRIETESFLETAEKQIKELQELEPDKPAHLLAEAALALRQDNRTRVMECLWPMKEGEKKLGSNQEKAVYLYLAKAVGLLPEENRSILQRLKTYYQEEPDSFLLLTLMMRESTAEDGPEKHLERLQLCYEAGCNSPFLFQAAWDLIAADERLLRRISPFIMRILMFAARYDLLTGSHLTRIAFLSHNVKRFSRRIYDLLAAGWEKYPSDEILEAVTSMLTKGQPVQPQYHKWYARAVARDLRITNLYEYYIDTITEDPEEGLPLPVLLYFSSNDTLSDKRRAFLYASIIRHRDQMPEFYQMYLGKMHSFAELALERGLMNEDFVLLYRTFFAKPEDGRTAALMAGVLFDRRFVCSSPEVQNLYVCYEGIQQEYCFPVIDGAAYPAIFTQDAALVFEDRSRRRFCTGVEYELTPLFEVEETAKASLQQNVRHDGLLYYGCGAHAHEMRIREGNLNMYRLAAENPAFTERYRQSIRRKLLDYYLGQPDNFGRIEFVDQMDPVRYAMADKAGTISLLVEEGRYEEAFTLLTEYGYERVGEGDLLQIASRMIMRHDHAYDEELLYLTLRVYGSGKYDDNMLVYLREYYDGPVRELSGLWKKLSGFQLETVHLSEKILKQSVFARVFPRYEDEILTDYIRARGSMKIAAAYLAHASRAFLTEDRKMPEPLFACTELLLDQEYPLSTGVKISLLKYYSTLSVLSEKQQKHAEALLAELVGRGIRFGFYQKLPPQLTERYQIADRIFIEEKMKAGAQVTIHYRLQEGTMVPGEWIHEPMREMYHGLYVKELLLFYGETLTYYVSETGKGTEPTGKEQQITITSTEMSGETRYAMLNRMLKARADGDDAGYISELNAYLLRDASVNELLPIIES